MTTIIFYASKLFRYTLASPLFMAFGFAAAALLAIKAQSGRVRLLKAIALALCLTVASLSTKVVANALVGIWETPLGDMSALAEAGPFDAIVILGGGSIDPISSSASQPQMNDSIERLTESVRLFRQGVAPVILFTGGTGNIAFPDKTEAPYAAAFLKFAGVPDDAIILESVSRNTHENAVYSKTVLERLGADRVVLVTSAWHMRRSAAIFRKAGINFTPYAVDSLNGPFAFPADLLPDAIALDYSTRIIREVIGVAAYSLLGRL